MKITKYARDVRFVEYYGEKRWSDINNVVGNTETSTAVTLTANSKEVPAGLYVSDFDLSVPYNCRATNIKIEVKLSSTGEAKSIEPYCSLFWGTQYSHWTSTGAKSESMNVNSYQIPPSTKEYPKAEQIKEFNIPVDAIKNKKITPEQINKNNFGAIFQFYGATGKDKTVLRVHWVRITVEYEKDSYSLSFKGAGWTTQEQAYNESQLSTDKTFTTTISCVNSATSSNNNHVVNVEIPVWLTVVDFSTTNSTFRKDTGEWYCKAGTTATLTLTLLSETVGAKKIYCHGAYAGSRTIYYDVKFGDKRYAEHLKIVPSNMRKGVKGYFIIDWYFISPTEEITLGFFDDDIHSPFRMTHYELDYANSDDGIDLIGNSDGGSVVALSVPKDKDCHVRLYCHCTPHEEGQKRLLIEDEVSSLDFIEHDYFVDEPYTYIFNLITRDLSITRSRIVSRVDSGAIILPCRTSPYDQNIIVKKPTLRAYLKKPVDYIGPIALEQTHYDPKSDYTDKLLNTSYKNKRYMGKEGASTEKITLNIRLHPYDVTTVQGLVDLDKPVPLNTNHKSFEGDSLNHRGWAELYEIKNVSKTNPHWYDTDISVSYITHNINTRFQIIKGTQVSDYFLPNLLRNSYQSGDDLGNFFNITTTGHFIYSDDEENPSKKNLFSLDEGEYVSIRTKDTLAIKSVCTFDWDSVKLDEVKDNNISRIIRIIDSKTGNSVLEYEYFDTDFSESYRYKTNVICRVLHKGAYKTVLNRSMYLHSDIEYENDDDGQDQYGSIIRFEIIGNKVSIVDEGWTGKDISIDNIEIEDGEYYFEVYFKNNNADIDVPPIVNFFDFSCQEIDMTSEYANYYQRMLVSPFPIPNKKIVFTRDSEEGTIYYLFDDGEEFSYLLEPFYQYYTGVNLETKDGISLMNLNNSYTRVYISNGLVKLGINRLTGELKLYKYDRNINDYVYVRALQLSKYKDVNLNYFTDDKIELQASDTTITMWRGRPFIQFKHPTEDIYIKEIATTVYAEGVGKYHSQFPQEWSLIQEFNIFPACVGSIKVLDEHCIELTAEQYSDDLSDVDITIDVPEFVGLNRNTTLRFTTTTNNNCHAFVFIDGELYSDDTIFRNNQISIPYSFDTVGDHTVQIMTPMCNNSYQYFISDVYTVRVEDVDYKITPLVPASMRYMDTDFKCKLTNDGQPVPNAPITFVVSGPFANVSYPNQMTDNNGIATLNNTLIPNDYQIGFEYYYYVGEDREMVYASTKTSIKKADVSIWIPHTWIARYDYFTFQLVNNVNPDEVENNYVANTLCSVQIKGKKTYMVTTDENGIGRLKMSLVKGNYNITVNFAGNSKYNAKSRKTEVKVG